MYVNSWIAVYPSRSGEAMRMLREVVVVGAIVGSISMFGAGAAFAGGHERAAPHRQLLTGRRGQHLGVADGRLINLFGPILSGGAADSSAVQQLCGINNQNAITPPARPPAAQAAPSASPSEVPGTHRYCHFGGRVHCPAPEACPGAGSTACLQACEFRNSGPQQRAQQYGPRDAISANNGEATTEAGFGTGAAQCRCALRATGAPRALADRKQRGQPLARHGKQKKPVTRESP